MTNSRNIVSAATTLTVLALLPTAAQAQSGSPLPSPFKKWALKIGYYRPSSDATRRATDNNYLTGGFTYDVSTPGVPVVGAILPKLAFEVFGDGITAGTEGTFLNGGIGTRVSLGATSPLYFGAGIGVSLLRTNFYDGNTGNRKKQTDFKQMSRYYLGWAFPAGFFAEVEYTRLGKVRDVNLDGLSLRGGYRF